MKIQDSSVQLSASHEASRSRNTQSTSSVGFRRFFEPLAAPAPDTERAGRQRVQKLLQALIDAILAALDGKKCEADFAAGVPLPGEQGAPGSRRELSWNWQATETVSESEATSVSGKGSVRTGDGRDIAFDFSLDLSRDYTCRSVIAESGRTVLHDPLVISFAGKSCELTGQRIAFDLDADGRPEQIPGLGAGSGFLVFDRNGRADDGSELFGVASGNGFSELAQLDDDQNGWIDEGDAAFGKLAVWSGDGFASLEARGVGALGTATVDAPFSLKTENNELLGQIRSVGLYLAETGEAGYLQQVDLALPVPSGERPDAAERRARST